MRLMFIRIILFLYYIYWFYERPQATMLNVKRAKVVMTFFTFFPTQ